MTQHETLQRPFVTRIVITFQQILVLVQLIKTMLNHRRALPQILTLVKVQFVILVLNYLRQVLNLFYKIVLLLPQFLKLNLNQSDLLTQNTVLLLKSICFLFLFIQHVFLDKLGMVCDALGFFCRFDLFIEIFHALNKGLVGIGDFLIGLLEE